VIRRAVLAGLAAIAYLACSLPLSAQAQLSRQADTTFTSNSELVLVPVQVMDRFGRPLHGLKKEDFVLKSDGDPQRISLFEEMQTAPVAAAAAKTPAPPPLLAAPGPASAAATTSTAGKFSNLQAKSTPTELFIVAIDTINTPLLLQSWARDQVVNYLKGRALRQPIEIVALTPDGLRQIHEFSTDSAALINSLTKLRGRLSSQDAQERLLSRMDAFGRVDSYAGLVAQQQQIQADEAARRTDSGSATLRAFEEMAWAYSGIPGRKTVLWLTCGFPIIQMVPSAPGLFSRAGGPYSATLQANNDLLPAFQRSFTALNKANVMVYPVDVNGLPMDSMWDVTQPSALIIHPELSHLGPSPMVDISAQNRDGMGELAHRTGGKTCTAGNNLNSCLEQALAESSDYYLLGFYVSQQHRKLGWRKLKVSVNVDHGEVRSRSSYYLRSLGIPPQREQEQDLRSAIGAGVNYTGVLFTVVPGIRSNQPKDPISFKVSVPPSSVLLLPGQQKLSFDVIAIPLSNRGTPVGKQSRIVKLDMTPEISQKALVSGWNVIDFVGPDPSVAAVKVVIRDNGTGRIGSVTFPVTPPSGG
jgi:VWFA-related protein